MCVCASSDLPGAQDGPVLLSGWLLWLTAAACMKELILNPKRCPVLLEIPSVALLVCVLGLRRCNPVLVKTLDCPFSRLDDSAHSYHMHARSPLCAEPAQLLRLAVSKTRHTPTCMCLCAVLTPVQPYSEHISAHSHMHRSPCKLCQHLFGLAVSTNSCAQAC